MYIYKGTIFLSYFPLLHVHVEHRIIFKEYIRAWSELNDYATVQVIHDDERAKLYLQLRSRKWMDC